MPKPDECENLFADFRALSAQQQREVRGSLTTFERIQFDALLNSIDGPIADEDSGAQEAFSHWLREHIHSAESGADKHGRSVITSSTREALLELAHAPATDCGGPVPEQPGRPRSLLGAFGALLSGEPRQ